MSPVALIGGLALSLSAVSGQLSLEVHQDPPDTATLLETNARNLKIILLQFREVQKELGISNEQKKSLEEALAPIGAQRIGLFNFIGQPGLSREERSRRITQDNARFEELNEREEEALQSILDAKQYVRFDQIVLQTQGGFALRGRNVADRLMLTEKQREGIRAIGSKLNQGTSDLAGSRVGVPLEERGKPAELVANTREGQDKVRLGMLAVLTSEQKETWEMMLG